MTPEQSSISTEVRAYGYAIIQKRFARLKDRKFVLFPWLRIALLLRKLKKLES